MNTFTKVRHGLRWWTAMLDQGGTGCFGNQIIDIRRLGPCALSSPAVLLAAIIVSTPSKAQEVWPTSSAWTSVTPGKVGMDLTRTATALKYGSDRGGSGILVRAGQRVGTWGSQTTNYILRSSTKSFGSVLLGLALKDVKLGLDTAVHRYSPNSACRRAQLRRRLGCPRSL